MLTVIKDESEKAAKKFSKSYLQSALRKKSSGSRCPTQSTEPPTNSGKKSKASLGRKQTTNTKVSFHDTTKFSNKNTKRNKLPDKPQPSNNNKKKKNTKNKSANDQKRTQNNGQQNKKPKQDRLAGKRKGVPNKNGSRKRAQQQK
jgi:hypothetical protein